MSASVQMDAASLRCYGMRALRRLLRAHWGKIACLAFGVGLAVGGSYYLWDQHRFAATAAHADGTIVGLEESTSTDEDGGTTYCPVVRFVSERQQTVQFTAGECSYPAPRVGRTVEVLYDPDHPQRANLGTMGAVLMRWFLGSVFTVIGLLFATGAVYSIAGAVSRRHGQQRGDRIQDNPARPQDTDTA